MPPLPDLAAYAALLADHPARRDDGVEPGRKAAVAAVLRGAGGDVELLFIRRAEHPRDPWSGQMGLPGGRVDPGDADPLAAAVRETREELALDLASHARLLGALSEVRTHLPLGRAPHSVAPFVFALEREPALVPNHEVQEALWVPLAFLADRGNRRSMTWVRAGVPLPMPCYQWRERIIWGLTLRIVDELLELSSPHGG
jgi:8-oxo-dGTP pyrophosphatase MutT (NUDIX family)